MYVDIAPTIPLRGKNQTYTYYSEGTVAPGAIVSIPFGPRTVSGVVITAPAKKPRYATKEIKKIYVPSLTLSQLTLAAQLARFTQGGLGYTLRLFFPATLQVKIAEYSQKKSRRKKEVEIFVDALSKRQQYFKKISQKTDSQAVIVVPERWMVGRFSFATPYHAGLTAKQQGKIWAQVASGEPITIVGTQKALFLPWQNVKTIIIDEAQLPTHKLWDQYPRLDNRRLATMLAENQASRLLLAGVFPSIQMHYAAATSVKSQQNPITLSYKTVSPSLEDRRSRLLIPNEFVAQLRAWLRAKEAILILLNEKDSSYHKALKKLRLLGRKNLTVDTTAAFAKHGDKIFDRVVWIAPERTLSFPDYASQENAYLLLARLQTLLKPRRKLILLTRKPQLVSELLPSHYKPTYEKIIRQRKRYQYPPHSDVVRLTFTDKSTKKAKRMAEAARKVIESELLESTRIVGPYPGLSKPKTNNYIALFGAAEELASHYANTPASNIELDPQHLL